MTAPAFAKTLSANDVGTTGGHQGGILVPKANAELLAFLPPLDPLLKNPSAWLDCLDEAGVQRRLRYVYYNNALHEPDGTRNEYRITHLTAYFRETSACAGDALVFSRGDGSGDRYFSISIVHKAGAAPAEAESDPVRIRIRPTWQRLH